MNFSWLPALLYRQKTASFAGINILISYIWICLFKAHFALALRSWCPLQWLFIAQPHLWFNSTHLWIWLAWIFPFYPEVKRKIFSIQLNAFFSVFVDKQLSVRTVRMYTAGACYKYCLESAVDNITKSRQIVRAIKEYARLLSPKLDTRSPVDLEIMKALKLRLSSSRDPAYNRHLIWTACVSALAGYLRVPEFTASKLIFKPNSSLLLGNVSYDGRVVTVLLKKSKTDQRAKGFLLRSEATRRTVCYVRAFWNYYKLRSLVFVDADLPFLIYSDGSFYPSYGFTVHWRNCFPIMPEYELTVIASAPLLQQPYVRTLSINIACLPMEDCSLCEVYTLHCVYSWNRNLWKIKVI